jgi:hypothetical protein
MANCIEWRNLTLMRLQQNTIIIHDKLFIIAILFAEENVTVSKSWRQNITTTIYGKLSLVVFFI